MPRLSLVSTSARQHVGGMALIAVLWIVAALSIMTIGVTHTVRQQIQMAGAQRDRTTGQALGEAAVALTLQQMQAQTDRLRGVTRVTVPYAGLEIEVEVAPLNGLISLGGANAELLAALLQVAGGLGAAQAQDLASRMVAWRDGRPELDVGVSAEGGRQARGFESPEDLLLVPGVDYGLYARVAPLVSADLGSTARVNPEAAPPAVLAVLAQGDRARVARYLSQRDSRQPGADTTGFNPAFIDTGGSSLYRLKASVPLDSGKILVLIQDVALGAAYSRTAPWRLLRAEQQMARAY